MHVKALLVPIAGSGPAHPDPSRAVGPDQKALAQISLNHDFLFSQMVKNLKSSSITGCARDYFFVENDP